MNDGAADADGSALSCVRWKLIIIPSGRTFNLHATWYPPLCFEDCSMHIFYPSDHCSTVTLIQNFVDGAFVPSASGQTLDDMEPATNHLLATIPRSNAEDANAAVAAAKAAHDGWSKLAVKIRSQWLSRIADAIQARFEEFVLAESQDCGKPLQLARTLDIPRAIDNFRYFSSRILHDETECHPMDDAVNYTQRSSVGVGVLVTPWNLPLYLLSWKVAPALACGNTVVCKPSEFTPLTAHLLATVMHEIGLPPGVFNIVHGLGGEVGAPLIEHEDVNLVSFTGGTVTGKRVGAAAIASFKKLSLELGGKNATMVFDDCDFDATVEGVFRASFLNSGQICLCGSRLFIQDGIYDKFIAALINKVKNTTVGDPATCTIGSLTSLQHRDKIEYYVQVAKDEGGEILCGGARPDLPEPFCNGAFYLPTLIGNLSVTSRCSREEIFGPVVVVHRFTQDDEVIQYANNTKYGLAGSVWTENVKRAHRVAQSIRTGMIWVNCWLKRDLRVPFGGVGDSGIGREGGMHSLEFYSELKNICIQL